MTNFDRWKELLAEAHAKFVFDPETGVLLHRSRGNPAGSNDGTGYKSVRVYGQKIKVHRLVWLMHYGEPPVGALDHVNGIRTDNRIANLRIATPAQNVHNRIRRAKFMTGVGKNERGRFVARITHGNEKLYLGYYDTEKEAAAAYAGAAIVLHGEFSAKLSREE